MGVDNGIDSLLPQLVDYLLDLLEVFIVILSSLMLQGFPKDP
jgi:hypothetical protein